MVNGHTHDFTINTTDLTQPGSSGDSRETTVVQGHSHTVSLSQDELNQIQANQSVTKETSLVNGHTHTFQFSLAGGTAVGGTTGSTGNNRTAGSTGTGNGGSTGTGTETGKTGTGRFAQLIH